MLAPSELRQQYSPVATSNSPTCGRVKLPHPGWRDERTLLGHEALGKHDGPVSDSPESRAQRLKIGGARVFHGGARVAPATHTSARRGGKRDSHEAFNGGQSG